MKNQVSASDVPKPLCTGESVETKTASPHPQGVDSVEEAAVK